MLMLLTKVMLGAGTTMTTTYYDYDYAHHTTTTTATADCLLNETHFPLDVNLAEADERGLAVLDTGCTFSVGGRKWLDGFAEKLLEFGLQPLRREHREVFRGLGGAKRES